MPSEDDVEMCQVEGCGPESECGDSVFICRCGGSVRRHYVHTDLCENCGQCETHCNEAGNCMGCEGCGVRGDADSYCSNCENLSCCCECRSCESCGERVNAENIYGCCDRCSDCGCSCEDAEPTPTGPFCTFPMRFHEASKKGFVTNPVKRLVSCEIEVASCDPAVNRDLKDAALKWGASIVEDGSLPSTGFEINTAPANGNLFELQTEEWCGILKRGNASITQSCGLHVHVDARDILADDLMKVLALYTRMEMGLFGLVAPSRKTNSTCAPVQDYFARAVRNYTQRQSAENRGEWRAVLRQGMYGLSAMKSKTAKRQRRPGCRYQSLNLHSYFYRKTLEFRLHHGTTDYRKIRNWSLLCASFVEKAIHSTWADINSWPRGITGLVRLAPDPASKQWVRERWEKFMPEDPIDEDGCEVAVGEV